MGCRVSKPVTGATIFGSNTSGTTTQLDNNLALAYTALNDLNTYSNFLTDTGSAGAMVVTLPANITGALTNGLVLQIKAAATNAGATTLNYNAGGPLNVLNLDGTALSAGQIPSGGIVQVAYRSSDTSWLLMTPSATGAVGQSMVLLQANQAANSNQIFFNNVITATYDTYVLKASGVKVAGNDSALMLRVGNGNTPTFQNANYLYTFLFSETSAGSGNMNDAAASGIFLTRGAGAGLYSGANAVLSGTINVSVVANANAPAMVDFSVGYMRAQAYVIDNVKGVGIWNNNIAVTSLQIVPSNANITSGNFALYGIRNT